MPGLALRRIAAAVLLTLALAGPAQALSPAEIANVATPAVVLIKVPNGLGSGFVVTPDGKIVTNFHVIRDVRLATVVTADGREYSDVEVMASDPAHDIAVLRIAARQLRALKLGNALTAVPGDHIVAIGHPLGLGSTVSDGLISAVRQYSQKLTLLQISAPISPGSSGGPVLNEKGEVIGISTLVVTGGQNLNFAVPINVVFPLLQANKGVPIAAYVPPGVRRRNVPNYPIALLNDCPTPQLRELLIELAQAVKVGAPLYNDGNVEACFRIYASAALQLSQQMPSCPGPKAALAAAVRRADQFTGWDDKAWILRDTFDGLFLVAQRQANGEQDAVVPAVMQRNTTQFPPSVLSGCERQQIATIQNSIVSAINSGAPLYSQGNAEACYRIYEGAISDIERSVPGCAAAKQALQQGRQNAARLADWREKAWVLRDTFDAMNEAIRRP